MFAHMFAHMLLPRRSQHLLARVVLSSAGCPLLDGQILVARFRASDDGPSANLRRLRAWKDCGGRAACRLLRGTIPGAPDFSSLHHQKQKPGPSPVAKPRLTVPTYVLRQDAESHPLARRVGLRRCSEFRVCPPRPSVRILPRCNGRLGSEHLERGSNCPVGPEAEPLLAKDFESCCFRAGLLGCANLPSTRAG